MSTKRLLLCTAVGMFLLTGGLTAFSYGLAQVIDTGNCGSSASGRRYGPPCPPGAGWMMMGLIGGVFVSLGGVFVFAMRGSRLRGSLGLGLLILGPLCVAGSAAVLGIVDVREADTRPGREVMWIAGAVGVLLALASAVPDRRRAGGQPAAGARERVGDLAAGLRQVVAQKSNAGTRAEEIASRLRQLDQLRQSGLLPEDDYAERRRQILAEL